MSFLPSMSYYSGGTCIIPRDTGGRRWLRLDGTSRDQAGRPGAGCPGGLWVSPRSETPQPPPATNASEPPPSQQKNPPRIFVRSGGVSHTSVPAHSSPQPPPWPPRAELRPACPTPGKSHSRPNSRPVFPLKRGKTRVCAAGGTPTTPQEFHEAFTRAVLEVRL